MLPALCTSVVLLMCHGSTSGLASGLSHYPSTSSRFSDSVGEYALRLPITSPADVEVYPLPSSPAAKTVEGDAIHNISLPFRFFNVSRREPVVFVNGTAMVSPSQRESLLRWASGEEEEKPSERNTRISFGLRRVVERHRFVRLEDLIAMGVGSRASGVPKVSHIFRSQEFLSLFNFTVGRLVAVESYLRHQTFSFSPLPFAGGSSHTATAVLTDLRLLCDILLCHIATAEDSFVTVPPLATATMDDKLSAKGEEKSAFPAYFFDMDLIPSHPTPTTRKHLLRPVTSISSVPPDDRDLSAAILRRRRGESDTESPDATFGRLIPGQWEDEDFAVVDWADGTIPVSGDAQPPSPSELARANGACLRVSRQHDASSSASSFIPAALRDSIMDGCMVTILEEAFQRELRRKIAAALRGLFNTNNGGERKGISGAGGLCTAASHSDNNKDGVADGDFLLGGGAGRARATNGDGDRVILRDSLNGTRVTVAETVVSSIASNSSAPSVADTTRKLNRMKVRLSLSEEAIRRCIQSVDNEEDGNGSKTLPSSLVSTVCLRDMIISPSSSSSSVGTAPLLSEVVPVYVAHWRVSQSRRYYIEDELAAHGIIQSRSSTGNSSVSTSPSFSSSTMSVLGGFINPFDGSYITPRIGKCFFSGLRDDRTIVDGVFTGTLKAKDVARHMEGLEAHRMRYAATVADVCGGDRSSHGDLSADSSLLAGPSSPAPSTPSPSPSSPYTYHRSNMGATIASRGAISLSEFSLLMKNAYGWYAYARAALAMAQGETAEEVGTAINDEDGSTDATEAAFQAAVAAVFSDFPEAILLNSTTAGTPTSDTNVSAHRQLSLLMTRLYQLDSPESHSTNSNSIRTAGRIVSRRAPYAVFAEDDATFRAGFPKRLRGLVQHARSVGPLRRVTVSATVRTTEGDGRKQQQQQILTTAPSEDRTPPAITPPLLREAIGGLITEAFQNLPPPRSPAMARKLQTLNVSALLASLNATHPLLRLDGTVPYLSAHLGVFQTPLLMDSIGDGGGDDSNGGEKGPNYGAQRARHHQHRRRAAPIDVAADASTEWDVLALSSSANNVVFFGTTSGEDRMVLGGDDVIEAQAPMKKRKPYPHLTSAAFVPGTAAYAVTLKGALKLLQGLPSVKAVDLHIVDSSLYYYTSAPSPTQGNGQHSLKGSGSATTSTIVNDPFMGAPNPAIAAALSGPSAPAEELSVGNATLPAAVSSSHPPSSNSYYFGPHAHRFRVFATVPQLALESIYGYPTTMPCLSKQLHHRAYCTIRDRRAPFDGIDDIPLDDEEEGGGAADGGSATAEGSSSGEQGTATVVERQQQRQQRKRPGGSEVLARGDGASYHFHEAAALEGVRSAMVAAEERRLDRLSREPPNDDEVGEEIDAVVGGGMSRSSCSGAGRGVQCANDDGLQSTPQQRSLHHHQQQQSQQQHRGPRNGFQPIVASRFGDAFEEALDKAIFEAREAMKTENYQRQRGRHSVDAFDDDAWLNGPMWTIGMNPQRSVIRLAGEPIGDSSDDTGVNPFAERQRLQAMRSSLAQQLLALVPAGDDGAPSPSVGGVQRDDSGDYYTQNDFGAASGVGMAPMREAQQPRQRERDGPRRSVADPLMKAKEGDNAHAGASSSPRPPQGGGGGKLSKKPTAANPSSSSSSARGAGARFAPNEGKRNAGKGARKQSKKKNGKSRGAGGSGNSGSQQKKKSMYGF